jgi:CxxC motif-containing protein (DUF1111 family)
VKSCASLSGVRLALFGFALLACSSEAQAPPAAAVEPLAGLSRELSATFDEGAVLFDTPVRRENGLGPLYTRTSCASCHAGALRGPGLVQKMSVVSEDGVTPASDQSSLAFGHTVRPLAAVDGISSILPPADVPNVKVSARLGPPLLGRGYIEAILDSEIERVAAEQATRTDGIQGRINRVTYASEPNVDRSFHTLAKGDEAIGRFGLKARAATIDDFVADAFQSDMGITTPLRPLELANPSGVTDDGKVGIDADYDSVNLRAMYVRMLELPERHTTEDGARLFAESACADCHVPSLATRADYPIPELAGIRAPVYTDMLLHRMGDALADGVPAEAGGDAEATSFEWRTAPLIGLRFYRAYLHDGRAKTIAEAIEMHRGNGSQANVALERFDALSDSDRAALLAFVAGL